MDRHLAVALSAASIVSVVVGVAALSAAPPPQRAAAPIEFEVASIKPSPDQIERASIGVRISGSQVRISSLTLKDYIGMAYRLPAGQINAPGWIAQERFDIAAKLPDGASSSQVPEMLQALLAAPALTWTLAADPPSVWGITSWRSGERPRRLSSPRSRAWSIVRFWTRPISRAHTISRSI